MNNLVEQKEFLDPRQQLKIILKGVEEVINQEELLKKLENSKKNNQPLTIKLGLDPSAPDIHLGHAVVLRKIKQMQDLGHQAVIIIGDFTGRIGDPSGKSKTRNQLTKEEVIENAKTYEKQIFKILDREKTKLCFNSSWLEKLNFEDVLELAGKVTVARILERDDFENRFKNNAPIGLHEFFYPLMQAYDSVEIKADIEIGGTDQRFNILMGRTLQKDFGIDSQIPLFMPLLEGTDGINKMSKSLGNYIGINEDANTIYQKVMTIPDEFIIKYFNLATDLHPDEVSKIEEELSEGRVNPRDIKMSLACEITALYQGIAKAEAAERNFQNVFQKNLLPDKMKEIAFEQIQSQVIDQDGMIDIPRILVHADLVKSTSEARRLIQQSGVKLDGNKLEDPKLIEISKDFVLQVGKSKFVKIIK